ncbi:hypothetical protein, partial [Novosphingobium sp. CCH12-A3]|uniref:hypothetical protein n=1 Tax=Novosphingobium sp. CCH12-A3 TaxID=1768752 RepID=UPI000A4A64A2
KMQPNGHTRFYTTLTDATTTHLAKSEFCIRNKMDATRSVASALYIANRDDFSRINDGESA